MLLIGMFDSPYVRRVAVSLKHPEVPFEHANWLVGSDFERMVRPPEKVHEPWLARCRDQMHGALGLLEAACGEPASAAWLVDGRLTQADITVACIATFLGESLDVFGGQASYPALRAHVGRCEALPEFRATHAPWFAAAMKS